MTKQDDSKTLSEIHSSVKNIEGVLTTVAVLQSESKNHKERLDKQDLSMDKKASKHEFDKHLDGHSKYNLMAWGAIVVAVAGAILGAMKLTG